MAKVVKISDENYARIEEVAFKNGVKIQHLMDEVIAYGIDACIKNTITVKERGRDVSIKW